MNGKRTGSFVRSEGQRLLMQVQASIQDICTAVSSTSKATVHGWRTGQKTPGGAYRQRLETAYDIPAASWEQAPLLAVPSPSRPPPAAGAAKVPLAPAGSEAHCLELIEVVRDLRVNGNLAASERLKAIGEERALLAQAARIRERTHNLQDQIIREHPDWPKFEEALVRALLAYPDAARAVAAVLDKF